MNRHLRWAGIGMLVLVMGPGGCALHGDRSPELERILKEDHDPPLPQGSDESDAGREADRVKKDRLNLADCFQLALLYNDRLRIAGEDYLQAIALKDETWAAVLPTLTARANYFRQEKMGSFGSLLRRKEQSFSLKQPLFSGFRDVHAIRQAEDRITSREEHIRFERQALFTLVAGGFYGILKLQQILATLEAMIQVQQERLRQMQERQNVGLARKTEVMLIETDLMDAQVQKSRAQGDLEIARAHLAVLLGRTMPQPLEDAPMPEPPSTLDTMIQQAIQERPDLKELEAQVRIAQEQISVIIGEYYPTISMQANAYTHREGPSEDIDWDVLLSAEWPLFEGGATGARLEGAHSQWRQAKAAYEAHKKEVGEEVTRAFYTYQSLAEEITALEKRARVAEENHTLVQEEYQQGLATSLEVQLVYQKWSDARLAFEQAGWEQKNAAVQIQFAIGQLK